MMKNFKGMLLVVLIFFISSLSLASKITITSFNTCNLGFQKKDYGNLCTLIKKSDIIALQEIRTRKGAKALLKNLIHYSRDSRSNWKMLISDKAAGSKVRKEYYVFIWKQKKIKLIRKLGFYDKHCFKRTPFAAYFKLKNTNTKFVLINFHIIFGKSILQREKEVSNITKVYDYFAKKINAPQDETQKDSKKKIFLLGDFNLNNNIFLNKLLKKHTPKLKNAISKETKTTLGSKQKFVSSYDKIITDESTLKHLKYAGIFYLKNLDNTYIRKHISDHLPVFGVFEF